MNLVTKSESEFAIATWRIAMAIMTLLMATLLALILDGINRTNSIALSAREINNKQDQSIILLQAQTHALEQNMSNTQRVTDATITSLQALTLQITRTEDKVGAIIDHQKGHK